MSESEPADLRASDGERDHAVARLRDAVVEGRLTLDEFSERVDRAHQTAGRAELERLVADLPSPATPAAAPAADASHRAICSHLSRRGPRRGSARSSFRCVFGTVDLDLREATLSGALVELDVYNLFGTVTVVVPAGVAVDVEGGGFLASQRIETPSTPPVADAPRLLIRTSGPGGTLHVRTSPHRTMIEAVRERAGLGRDPAR